MSIQEIDCFATPDTQARLETRLQQHWLQNQALSLATIMHIDENIDKRCSDMILRGWSRDACVDHITEKCPELYLTQNIAAGAGSSNAGGGGGGDGGGGGGTGGTGGGRRELRVAARSW